MVPWGPSEQLKVRTYHSSDYTGAPMELFGDGGHAGVAAPLLKHLTRMRVYEKIAGANLLNLQRPE